MEEAIYKPCMVHLNTSTSYVPSKWDLHLKFIHIIMFTLLIIISLGRHN